MKAAFAAFSLLACGCQHSTELLLVFSSDLPTTAYAALAVDVARSDADAAAFSSTYLVPQDTTLPASLDLRGAANVSASIDARLLAPDGTTLVERRAVVPFVSGRALLLGLALDQSCADVICPADRTCIDGACASDVVDPATLPVVSGDPLTANASADLAFCPAIPAPPSNGCPTFFFDGTTPASQYTEVEPANGTKVDSLCGHKEIVSDSLSHGYGMEYLVGAKAPIDTAYTISAGYWAQTSGGGYAGLIADATTAGQYFAGATTALQPNGDTATLLSSASLNGATGIMGGATSVHVASLSRELALVTGGSIFTFTVDGVSEQYTVTSIPNAQTPSFFVGNDGAGTAGDTIFVQLAWVQLCTSP